MNSKHEYLVIIVVIFIIVIVLAGCVSYLYHKNFMVNTRSLIKFLIENEEMSIYSAQRLLQTTSDSELRATVNDYIQRSQQNINALQKFLSAN